MAGQAQWQKLTFAHTGTGALCGLRVLDLSRLVAGNMTSLQLADFGADVIKVEPLPWGDPLRAWKKDGYASFWKVYGRNKRSLALDFRSGQATDILERLTGKTDVLIESFRPGTLEEMGLAPTELLKKHPDLVVLRVSGFGQHGPYSPRPGFGTLVEALSGFAHRNGEAGGGPLLPPLALADMISGLYGASAVMMALYAKEHGTGGGQIIDLALLDSMVSVLGPEALDFAITSAPKARVGNGSNTSSPRNVYATADGHFIAISASVQSTAARLFEVIGRPDMNNDPRYATNEARCKRHHEVDAIVGKWIGAHTRDDLLDIFASADITAAPLYDIEDISRDPHFIERGIYVDVPDDELGSVAMHSPVPTLSATPGQIRSKAPNIGQHSYEILTEIGLKHDDIRALIDEGSLKGEYT